MLNAIVMALMIGPHITAERGLLRLVMNDLRIITATQLIARQPRCRTEVITISRCRAFYTIGMNYTPNEIIKG